MRNRSRGRGRRGKPDGGRPAPKSTSSLPPLQPVYPEERWEGSDEFEDRQPDTNAATIELSGLGQSPSFRRPEPRPQPRPVEPRPQAPRPDDPAQPSGSQPGQPSGRSRRRRRGGRGRGQGRGAPAAPAPSAQTQALPALAPGAGEPEVEMPAQEAGPEFAAEPKPAAQQPAPKQPKGVVVLTIGLPGSGKSTWFKRRGVTPLSSDMLRALLFDDTTEQRYQHLVFSTLRSLLRARLLAHMPWNYVDATNLSPKERRHWVQMARSFGYEVHAVFFDVPVEVCMERNRRRERVVPEDVMQRMAAKLQPPKFEEGFAKITVVRVKRSAEAGDGAESAAESAPE